MRLKSITISGFGGIADDVFVDLSADVVIIVGANGYGKTTVCNAISWVLTGKSPSSQGPRNLYSKSGATTVDLLADFEGEIVSITRSIENPGEKDPNKLQCPLRLRTSAGALSGAAAEVWLRHHLTGAETNDDFESLAESFMDSIYLHQESLRDFLTGQQDTERFDAIASMVGAGRLRKFVDDFQSHKRAWARAVNKSDASLADEREKLEDLNATLSILDQEIANTDGPAAQERWRSWIAEIRSLNVEMNGGREDELTEHSLGNFRRSLAFARTELERKQSVLLAAQAELHVPLPEVPEPSAIAEINTAIAETTAESTVAHREAESLGTSVARAEDTLRQAESIREDLANMAVILLRHVSDNCVACGQSVDQEGYRARLENLASDSADIELRESLVRQRVELANAQRRTRDASRRLMLLRDQLRTLEEQRASAEAAQGHRTRRLREVLQLLGRAYSASDYMSGLKAIDAELGHLSRLRDRMTMLLEAGRQFEAAASLDSSKGRRERLAAEIEALRQTLSGEEADILIRRETDNTASALLDAVKVEAENFVAGRLAQLRPLLNQCYAAIDPHPTFRSVDIATGQFRGKHRLAPVLRDDEMNIDVNEPGQTLSTSQANALAVSLFLSFNLGFAPTHMKALVLDDPLQNLDDVHLLGLVDLLRKILPFRQLILTTHDHAFASLLARKLRPVQADARTTFVRFTKWDRRGPGVEQWDVPAESNPLKLTRM